jgi:hypothetical protein
MAKRGLRRCQPVTVYHLRAIGKNGRRRSDRFRRRPVKQRTLLFGRNETLPAGSPEFAPVARPNGTAECDIPISVETLISRVLSIVQAADRLAQWTN